jgi:hypothetical protein
MAMLLNLWHDAHKIYYPNEDLTKEHFRITKLLDFGEYRERWFAVNKSLIHGNWEEEFDNYDSAHAAIEKRIREQTEETVYLFFHDVEQRSSKKFERDAADTSSMYKIRERLESL